MGQNELSSSATTRSVESLVHASDASAPPEVPTLDGDETAEITRLMNALAHLREVESELSEASRAALGLTVREMEALRFLVVATREEGIVTPSVLAGHLGSSAASITKLLNSLEAREHVTRSLHPEDRRALRIIVNPRTAALIQRTAGRQQARRFTAAARLSSDERAVVTGFLESMASELAGDREDWAPANGDG